MEDLEPRGNYQVLAFAPAGDRMFSEVHLMMEVGEDCYVLCMKTPAAVSELIRRLTMMNEVVFGNAGTEKH